MIKMIQNVNDMSIGELELMKHQLLSKVEDIDNIICGRLKGETK